MRGHARHHIPIIKEPFQDLAVISAATIKGYVDLPILPLEIELFIAEQVELAMLNDEIESLSKLQNTSKPLFIPIQIGSISNFFKLLEKYSLYRDLEYDSDAFDSAVIVGHTDMIKFLYHYFLEKSRSKRGCASASRLQSALL